MKNVALSATKQSTFRVLSGKPARTDCTQHHTSHLTSVKRQLTVLRIRDDCDSGCGELRAQTAPHGHAEGDIEALLVFVQRVINYHHPAGFLHLSLVESQDAVVVLGPGDVIGVGQDGGGNGAFG